MPGMPRQLGSFDEELVDSLRNDSLHLILFPTEQCNFRCIYCYEDFSIGRMAPEIVEGIKQLISRRASELKYLSVTWFGGEPLLARSIVEDIASHTTRLVQEWHNDLRYESEMTTNGYLLDRAVVERLAGLGVQGYQISLDGPDQFHDRTRIRADGRGSYDRIWRNLLSIRESTVEVKILLRIHLTPTNLLVMPDFITLVRDTFLNDPRFTVFLKPVVRLGGPNDATMDTVGSDDYAYIAALEKLALEGGDARRLYKPTEVCYAARANSLLVRADGRLGKCTVALRDPANSIGRLLPDGSLQINNTRLRAWFQGWESRDQELIDCPASKRFFNQ